MQYNVVSGAEHHAKTARLKDLTPLSEIMIDAKGDYHFFKYSGAYDRSDRAGRRIRGFSIPKEAHRPSCSYEGYQGLVKKLVFKVKINASLNSN